MPSQVTFAPSITVPSIFVSKVIGILSLGLGRSRKLTAFQRKAKQEVYSEAKNAGFRMYPHTATDTKPLDEQAQIESIDISLNTHLKHPMLVRRSTMTH